MGPVSRDTDILETLQRYNHLCQVQSNQNRQIRMSMVITLWTSLTRFPSAGSELHTCALQHIHSTLVIWPPSVVTEDDMPPLFSITHHPHKLPQMVLQETKSVQMGFAWLSRNWNWIVIDSLGKELTPTFEHTNFEQREFDLCYIHWREGGCCQTKLKTKLTIDGGGIYTWIVNSSVC